MTHMELLRLWQPTVAKSEITGNLFIALTRAEEECVKCQFCQSAIPSELLCPNCHKRVAITPGAVLGCAQTECAGRLWNFICCPACDALVDDKGQPATAPHASTDVALANLFTALDMFLDRARAVPGVEHHGDLQKQLSFLGSVKERVTALHAQERARHAMIMEQLSAAVRTNHEEGEAMQKRMEAASQPLPRLNGYELGQALLRNLGIHV